MTALPLPTVLLIGSIPCPLTRMPAKHVAVIVANEFKVQTRAMISHQCGPHLFRPRHILWWLLRQQGRSLPQIGKLYGFHHTTILSGTRAIAEERKHNALLNAQLKGLLGKIGANAH